MIKGVKKIKWAGEGIVKKDLSTPNKKVVIAPDQQVLFEVEKWYDATPETDKKKHITWIFQDQKAKTIVLQKTLPASNRYGIKIPKNLCGPFEYYLEASLSGKRDLINKTGLLISGDCPAKIVNSKWCTTNDGKDVRKEHFFNYGETVYLNLMTEGLNGNLNLSIDIFRNISGKDDPCVFRYTSVDVIDGEVNLAIKNTFSWYSNLKGIKETEEFYVKVFDPVIKTYISDGNNDTIHARFLRINKKIASIEIKPPTNLSPLKIGEPEKNFKTPTFCRYNKIVVNDTDNDKNKFDLTLYDSVTTKNVLEYETIAGSSDDKKKSLDFTFLDLDTSKACFNKGRADEHKKEVVIYLNGVKQKAEVIKKEHLNLEVISDNNLVLLRTTPELFFLSPDKVSKYQIFAHTCAQPAGVINLNVYPNIEREVAFVLTLFKTLNLEVNQKFSTRETLTDYNKKQSMQLIRNELEILYQTKGGLGYGLSAKVKIDNVESSIELGKTKSQIKKLIGFYNTVKEVLSVFDGQGREEDSIAYKKKILPKVTFDIEPPNIALALRITNRKIEKSTEIVRQLTGALALKPITKIKIGVDLLSLLQYMGIAGKISDWIKTALEKKYHFTIYIIFEFSLEAKGELSLTYNNVEGFAPGSRKLQIEPGIGIKGGVKSTEFVSVLVPEADGKMQETKVEKWKGEATGASSILYTYEIKSDKKGQFSQHKMEFTGIKATIVIYAIKQGMKYNETFRKDFTIIEKPSKPWYESDKEYTL
nr:hypothetical protein [uncultured Flavobacterium sp.]